MLCLIEVATRKGYVSPMKTKKEAESKKVPYPKEYLEKKPAPTNEFIKKVVNEGFKNDKYEKIPDDVKKIMLEGYQKNTDILNKYGYYPYEQSDVFFSNLLRFVGTMGSRENRESKLIEARKKLISSLEDVRKVHEKEFGKAKEDVKPKEEKTFAQKDLDRAEAKRIHGMVAEMEPPIDAEQVALRYLAEGGKVSQDAINEVSGTTKRASLNTGRRELKTEEAKARDYAGGTESLDDLAHRLWEASGQEISERDIKDALMSEIGNNNTRLDASKAYLERYNIEYQQEKYYERFIEEREEQHAKVQDELERDFQSFKLGLILRQAREQKNMTQEQLGTILNKKRSYISRVENDGSNVTMKTLYDIVEKGLGGKVKISIEI